MQRAGLDASFLERPQGEPERAARAANVAARLEADRAGLASWMVGRLAHRRTEEPAWIDEGGPA